MRMNNKQRNRGFTVTELAVGILVASVVLAGIGAFLADGHRGWNFIYNRAYGDVPTGSTIAIRFFEAAMRKAQADGFLIDEAGQWIEAQYYANDASTAPDQYVRIYVSQDELTAEYGQLDPRSTLTTQTICENLSACTFTQAGRSIHMVLTLDDGTQRQEIVTSAFMHN